MMCIIPDNSTWWAEYGKDLFYMLLGSGISFYASGATAVQDNLIWDRGQLFFGLVSLV